MSTRIEVIPETIRRPLGFSAMALHPLPGWPSMYRAVFGPTRLTQAGARKAAARRAEIAYVDAVEEYAADPGASRDPITFWVSR